jgi:hypothetical protein
LLADHFDGGHVDNNRDHDACNDMTPTLQMISLLRSYLEHLDDSGGVDLLDDLEVGVLHGRGGLELRAAVRQVDGLRRRDQACKTRRTPTLSHINTR